MARLKDRYQNEIVPHLTQKLGEANALAVPRLDKIVVNMGVGSAVDDKAVLEAASADLATITGQKAMVTIARQSVSSFRLREGSPIGCKVTLRSERMYEFLDRLINVALPRIRDFRGLSTRSFDKQGNYSLGISEQSVFPEIDPSKMSNVQGMDITLVISNGSPAASRELLTMLGMPFARS